MSEYIVTIIVSIFASTGFWTLINTLVQNNKTRKSVERTALLGLLHDKIYSLCQQYINKGYVTLEEFENLEYLYRPYKQMGGNGTGEKLYKAVLALPMRNEDGETKKE